MEESYQESMLHRSHPWHGLSLGDDSPNEVNCYIEMVPTDTVKYEMDKETGLLKVDRPQKYSSLCPSLYGFLPRTYAGQRVADHCMEKTGRKNLQGDADPIDICVFTEKTIVRGDLVVRSVPIGGFRLLDGNEVDDKIISVMVGDFVYGDIVDIQHCPENLIERLRHYFLTYKDAPERDHCVVTITDIYGAEEAMEIIQLANQDYYDYLKTL
jgi:inorganic pyrophosphatase